MSKMETLDYDDWEEVREVGHQMIDDAITYLKNLRQEAPWRAMTEEDKQFFSARVPLEGQSPSQVYKLYETRIFPYIMGNPHPRFWAWYMGSSSMMGAFADFLTSITNSNAGAGNHVGQFIEDQVIRWMNEIVGYPANSSGLIVSGGSMANFVGLTVARQVHAGFDIRKDGLRSSRKQMTVYASTEVHSCNQKALELLGIGNAHLRKIPVKKDYTLNIFELQKAIEYDRADDYLPICIIGSAGTVNTGAVDDLEAIANICKKEGLWFHLDGAIGAIAMISDLVKPLLQGIEHSDSVALDLHKWLHIPFEAGCVLVRNRQQHRDAFRLTPEYLEQSVRGLASGTNWYSEYGLQLSRRLKALKVWMCIQEQGIHKLGRLIDQNVRQALYLKQLIIENPYLELMAPVGLDIVCFRFYTDVNSPSLNALNKELLIQLHERGVAIPSYTTLNGHYCIRVAIANHRSRNEDFDYFIQKTVEIGLELVKSIS